MSVLGLWLDELEIEDVETGDAVLLTGVVSLAEGFEVVCAAEVVEAGLVVATEDVVGIGWTDVWLLRTVDEEVVLAVVRGPATLLVEPRAVELDGLNDVLLEDELGKGLPVVVPVEVRSAEAAMLEVVVVKGELNEEPVEVVPGREVLSVVAPVEVDWLVDDPTVPATIGVVAVLLTLSDAVDEGEFEVVPLVPALVPLLPETWHEVEPVTEDRPETDEKSWHSDVVTVIAMH